MKQSVTQDNKKTSIYNAYIAPCQDKHKALTHGSHSFTCKLHHACLLFRKRSPDGATHKWGGRHLMRACYWFIDPEGMKGWVGLVGWPIADGLRTYVVIHQLQVERRTVKSAGEKTDVLSLFHATTDTRSTLSSVSFHAGHCYIQYKLHNDPHAEKRISGNRHVPVIKAFKINVFNHWLSNCVTNC